MVGDKNSNSTVLQFKHGLLEVGNSYGIDSREGFVQEKNFGIGNERPCDLAPATFSAGERLSKVVAEVDNPEVLEQLLDDVVTPLLAHAVAMLKDSQQVLSDCKMAEH